MDTRAKLELARSVGCHYSGRLDNIQSWCAAQETVRPTNGTNIQRCGGGRADCWPNCHYPSLVSPHINKDTLLTPGNVTNTVHHKIWFDITLGGCYYFLPSLWFLGLNRQSIQIEDWKVELIGVEMQMHWAEFCYFYQELLLNNGRMFFALENIAGSPWLGSLSITLHLVLHLLSPPLIPSDESHSLHSKDVGNQNFYFHFCLLTSDGKKINEDVLISELKLGRWK